eukprot:908721_1
MYLTFQSLQSRSFTILDKSQSANLRKQNKYKSSLKNIQIEHNSGQIEINPNVFNVSKLTIEIVHNSGQITIGQSSNTNKNQPQINHFTFNSRCNEVTITNNNNVNANCYESDSSDDSSDSDDSYSSSSGDDNRNRRRQSNLAHQNRNGHTQQQRDRYGGYQRYR